jgi:hypothetical protein
MGLGGPLVRDEKAETTVWLLKEYPGCSMRPAHPCRKTRGVLGQQDNFREVSSWQRRATARATLLRIAFAIVLDPKPCPGRPIFSSLAGSHVERLQHFAVSLAVPFKYFRLFSLIRCLK